MMNEVHEGEMAKIFLKNGKQQYGLLLNDVNQPETFENGIKFISCENVGAWLQTSLQKFVQILDPDTVDGIDLFLK